MNTLGLIVGGGLGGALGGGLIGLLLAALIGFICFAIVYAMGAWLIPKITSEGIVMVIWKALFVIVGGIFVIDFLLSLIGHGFIAI